MDQKQDFKKYDMTLFCGQLAELRSRSLYNFTYRHSECEVGPILGQWGINDPFNVITKLVILPSS